MRRRPRLLAGKSRRRTPRAMLGTAQMHSIVRDFAGVEPVLIDRRDEELRPPVELPAVPSAGGSLPPLRPRQPLLLQRVQRARAPRGAAAFRAALPGQPAGASQARGAPETLSGSAALSGASGWGLRAESDASPFDPRAPPSCCATDAEEASRNTPLRGRGARRGLPLPSLRPVLRGVRPSGPAPGAAPGTREVR